VGCDGAAALQTLLTPREEVTANISNSDIISRIKDVWQLSRSKPLLVHIKGHKDKHNVELTRLEKMNVLMDKLATLTATECPQRFDEVLLPDIGLPPVYYQGCITGQLTKTVYHKITAKSLLDYMANRVFINPIEQSSVCWDALRYARARVSLSINLFMTKWISNTVATGMVMQQRKHRVFNRCPRCNNWGEDRQHILICWDIRAKVIWDRQIKKLNALLVQEQTHPDIIGYIIHSLTTFRNQQRRQYPGHIFDWQKEQEDISMMNFIMGFMGTKLINFQHQHYRNIGSRKGGIPWAGKLIIQCWTLIHSMWLGRNHVLHQKEIINSLSGHILLDIAVEQEYELGCAQLPTVLHKWFRKTKEQLLNETVDYKRGWLLLIRSAKESMNIAEYNIFSSSKTLRRWIGLPSPNLKKKKKTKTVHTLTSVVRLK
jgi:hypothetical protein